MIISMASRCFWKSLENSILLHSMAWHEHVIAIHGGPLLMRRGAAGQCERQHEACLNCSDARGPSSAARASSSSSPGASNLPALPLSLLARSSFLVLSARQGPAGPAASAALLFCLGRAPCKRQSRLSTTVLLLISNLSAYTTCTPGHDG